MVTREDFFKNLEFEGGSRTRGTSDLDVSLTCVKYAHGQMRMSFTFRNGVYEKLSTTGRLRFALYKNRIIFQDSEKGLKFYKGTKSDTNTRYVQLAPNDLEAWKTFIGDYDLKFDEFYEYYYIERV